MFKPLIAFCLSRRAIVVLGLLVFAGAGLVAFKKLNIEAYPNPTPVILEITAQAPGLSAEEMERYYTRPMEIGLYSTPGIDVIFIGTSDLSFSLGLRGKQDDPKHREAVAKIERHSKGREVPAV